MVHVTVVGGGLGGLVAAITAAERGATVRLHEAHRSVGGRWRATSAPHIVHEGPHVIYSDGPTWRWLKQRGLLGTTKAVPVSALRRFFFRYNGELRRMPPAAFVRAIVSREKSVPIDRSYREWATERFGEKTAEVSASATGVGLFHWDPGELSAAFVWERARRVFSFPPAAGYREGGWGAMFDSLADYARTLGVTIELGSRVSEIDGITIVATELESARALLGDETLDWPSGKTALLDLGLRSHPRDAFVVSDLDDAGWLERFSTPDPSLAPEGESIVQIQMPLRPGETKASGTARLERVADLALPDWRDRTTFRRDATANKRTGALDYPGTSWRDRPVIDRGDDVYLVGDRVAAPGLLSEVSFSSGVRAAELAVPR